MTSEDQEIRFDGKDVCVLDKWKVKVGARIGQSGHLLFAYRNCNPSLEPVGDQLKYKCKSGGIIITSLAKKEGELIVPNDVIVRYTECLHNTVMKDLCADCGANINTLDDSQRKRIAELTSISMVHSVPELRVSKERAETLGRADEQRLLKDRKLVLLVDLDQTLIHSTNHNIPADMPDVHHFQLYGPHTQWYHTKFRPHTMDFLKSMSKLYELHICTFGARRYAHTIAHLMDPKEEFFPKDRILSRDECFDTSLKTGNMKSLFPCGDSMVCIIDDREDVWNYSPNLVAVRPYVCFKDTGDINAPERGPNDVFGNPEVKITDKADELKEFTKREAIDDNQSSEKVDTNESIVEIEEKTKEIKETIENNDKSSDENDVKTNVLIENSDKNVTKTEEIDSTEKPSEDEVNKGQENNQKVDTPSVDNNSSNTSTEEQTIDKKNESDSNSSYDVTIGSPSDSNDKRRDMCDDNDDYLLYLEEILTRIHSEYYKEYDEKMKYKSDDEEIKLPDLKQVIPKVRKCVLRGVNIVFSGVIPTNIPPEKNKLYNIAKSFGANITQDLVLSGSPKTTHLVAAKWGTAKVNACIKAKRIFIVNTNWLSCCAERWERVDERLYPLDKEIPNNEKNEKTAKKTALDNKNLKPDVKCSSSKSESQVVTTYATYDPKTGKRIRPEDQTTNVFLDISSDVELKTSETVTEGKSWDKSRQIEPHNMLEFSPLSGFSSSELRDMGKEVDDACSEGDELSTGNTDSEDSDIGVDDLKLKGEKRLISSSDESDDGECPKGWNLNKKKRPESDRIRALDLDEVNDSTRDSFDFENRPTVIDDESTDNESIGSVDEEMALAVEREFLS